MLSFTSRIADGLVPRPLQPEVQTTTANASITTAGTALGWFDDNVAFVQQTICTKTNSHSLVVAIFYLQC